MNVKHLHMQAQELFGKRGMLMSLWQEQADNFYPERADFTLRRALGTDFAANLITSFPILCRRDLQDQISTMLRPANKAWAHMTTMDVKKEDTESKRWMQWAEETMRRAMYDPESQFNRATKEGDGDFAAFGQCVLSVRMNKYHDGLVYRCWHLRDVAWMENEDGKICAIFRKWNPTAYDLKEKFGGRIHAEVAKAATGNNPFQRFDCMHMMVMRDLYEGDGNKLNLPWVSIHYDVANEHAMEEIGQRTKEYILPRWQTVSGSQYAFSPATVAALPEARLIQAMTYTLLEAGEKATNPPVVATIGAVRSDIALYAGGETWVDGEYDERLGEALRPLQQDLRGLPIGIEMQKDSRLIISQAFYLNKLSLPRGGPEMTAYEVGQLVQEYIRAALPLFEPMEADYNGQLCEETFDLLRYNGAFGSMRDMPKPLQGQQMRWRFEGPLHDMIENQKGHKFMEAKALVAVALEIDQSAANVIDGKTALRDALDGIGVPAAWQRTASEVDELDAKQASQQATAQILANLEQGSKVAGNLASAQKDAAAAAPPAPAPQAIAA